MSPASVLMFVKRRFFLIVLTFAIDFIPSNSSRMFCTFSCLLDLLLSLIPFFDLLASVSHLGLFFFVDVFLFSMRAESCLLVFAGDRFFPARCRHSRVLLLCFTSQFFSLLFRRCRVLLLRYFGLLVCRCFMFASEPLSKFIISSRFHGFSDGSGRSRVSTDADCLVYLVFLVKIVFPILVRLSS